MDKINIKEVVMKRFRQKTVGRKKGHRYVYAVRTKKGRYKDIQNIGRASRGDRRQKAKRKLKRSNPGYGMIGDYVY